MLAVVGLPPIYGAERLTCHHHMERDVGQIPIKGTGTRHTNHIAKPDPDPKCPNPQTYYFREIHIRPFGTVTTSNLYNKRPYYCILTMFRAAVRAPPTCKLQHCSR